MSDTNNNDARDLSKDIHCHSSSSSSSRVAQVAQGVDLSRSARSSTPVESHASGDLQSSQELSASQKSSSQSSSSLGPEGQSLLCSESMLSSTASSEDSLSLSQHDTDSTAPVWKYDSKSQQSRLQHSPNKFSSPLSKDSNCRDSLHAVGNPSARYNLASSLSASASSLESSSRRATVGSLLNQVNERRGEGYAGPLDRRMNANGLDRTAMTGNTNTTTPENLSWLSTRVCTAQAQRHPSGIITSIPGHTSHDQHPLMLHGTTGLIQPSVAGADVLSRPIYPGGQYPVPVYTTTGSSLSPYSPAPLFTPGQSQPPSPYSAFFRHYASYPPGASSAFLQGAPPHYHPMATTYSHVLASMVQESPQLPRLPYTGLHHYPHGPLSSPTNSPGPSSLRALTPSQSLTPPTSSLSHVQSAHDSRKSPKLEAKDTSARAARHGGSPKDVKPLHHPFPAPHVRHGIQQPHHSTRESPPSDTSKAYGARDPARKHRMYVGPDTYETKHGGAKSEETLHKRPRVGGLTYHQPPPAHTVHTTSIPHSSPGSQTPGPGAGLPSASYPTPHYPPHFMKGSIIQLANGDLKRVEDLRTDDFVNSAEISSDLKIDSSTVVRIEENAERGTAILGFSVGEHRIQVTVEATLEHPFFVFGQGWSSCSPQRTQQRYGLHCSRLLVGDVCISLTHKDPGSQAAVLAASQLQQGQPEPASQISEQQRGGASELWRHSGSGLPSRAPPPRRVGSETRHTPPDTAAPQSHPETPSSAPRDTQSGLASFPASLSRRRRWSAPDQIHTDSPASGRATTPAAAAAVAVTARHSRTPDESGDAGKPGKKQQQQQPEKDKDSEHGRT